MHQQKTQNNLRTKVTVAVLLFDQMWWWWWWAEVEKSACILSEKTSLLEIIGVHLVALMFIREIIDV